MEVGAVSLEKLCKFSSRTQTLITADAPLFGTFQILDGQLLYRKSSVKSKGRNESPGLPSAESVLENASRFWIQDHLGVRDLKSREEMIALLDKI